MSITVQFDQVSKKYRLGMTRTSLPTLITQWAQTALRHKRYETRDRFHWAIKEISFALRPGESLALVGPNGAGKTTILKLLAQITKPTSGSIDIHGKLSALIELGAGFHPDLSGRENIYLNGTILGLDRTAIHQRFDEIVAFSELEEFIDTPVKRYSSGMAVRLGFSVAASIDPDILLVDEVLAVGDTSFRLKCMQRIDELLRNGTTLIFVSHNMSLVKAVCKTGLYIDHGQLKYLGDINTAVENYNRDLNERRKSQLSTTAKQAPAYQSNNLEIIKVEIVGQNPRSDGALRTNQPAEIKVQYRAQEKVGPISVVLRIIRSDGVSCSVMYSRIEDLIFTLDRGEGEISATISPLQLFPGTYYIAATLKNETESHTYDLGKSDWFDVASEIEGFEDRDAVFEPNRMWAHHSYNHSKPDVR